MKWSIRFFAEGYDPAPLWIGGHPTIAPPYNDLNEVYRQCQQTNEKTARAIKQPNSFNGAQAKTPYWVEELP